jgi:hypothetical protein
MSNGSADTRFHETWLGLVQPLDGLVVSLPVLVEAQCMQRQPAGTQQRLLELCPPVDGDDEEPGPRAIADLTVFLAELLGLTPDLFDTNEALPEDLALWVSEGRQLLRPTMALRRRGTPVASGDAEEGPVADDSTPASRAGAGYLMLVWEIPDGLELDRAETVTGDWEYPPAAKLDRLLRHCRVPIGLLCNRRALRLVYAPHGESSGSISFRIDDMATVGGRPILDALVMLLGVNRFFGVAPERQLPALLAASRKRQADVTNELAAQVFDALAILLAGFEAAAERDGRELLDDALHRDDDHLYGGLLTVLLRLVFLLYAEDRGLLPTDNELYARSFSLLGLYADLQRDHGSFPDSMARRFGAWPRLIALFRAVFLGVRHGDLVMPPRQGQLFDPHLYPFLEGWGPGGGAPITMAEHRAAVRVPTVDDGTVYRVLEKLIVFQGQRLSYRSLDVEQIGSVYEALMGFHIVRVSAPAVRLRPAGVWVTADEVMALPASQRARWLKLEGGMVKAQAGKLARQLRDAEKEGADAAQLLELLDTHRMRGSHRAASGGLVIQPGAERRRTSSHYTPRSLSAPIVRRTMAPLLAAMGPEPSSERLLRLTICDPAMGSGAFLVEACRYLADQVVAAWTREGRIAEIAAAHDDVVNHARRQVAQRCLYGVDKNRFAVNLAKLSLWLVTLARDLPFTFLDHALRHGDALVGLDFRQIEEFHWQATQQIGLFTGEVRAALDEAIDLRQQIHQLADATDTGADREKAWLFRDADDALDRIRLIGDLVVGAFFSSGKPRERERERKRRLELVREWLVTDEPAPVELRALQNEIRERIPVLHWMVEMPEVFYAERPDPLEQDRVNRAAYMDAFVGNPPFAGKNGINEMGGPGYLDWLKTIHPGSHGNADYCAHFFRRADVLLGIHGCTGLIATNTIAQGDTRTTGLKWLVDNDHTIYRATRSMLWPGDAAVAVAVVHMAKGSVGETDLEYRLDGEMVETVNSRLRSKPERPDPMVLSANAGMSFVGTYVLGMGFTLTPDQREELVARDSRNAERIFPYLGGEEVNSSPTQSHHRYVISFGQMTLHEAESWPDLITIVRENVKPERDRLKDNPDGRRRKQYWWQYGRETPALHSAICDLDRCLVTSRHTKHLTFAYQPTNRVFSEALLVFPILYYRNFAVLQSSVHSFWAWLLSSSIKGDLRYSPSDCFETFPFPQSDPRAEIPELEEVGERLYTARARYMVATDQGLTQTYNRLKDPACDEPEIVELRRQHEEIDRAVLAAYDWGDIPVPAYGTPVSEAERRAKELFEDEVIDRLFLLNQQRAREEQILGLTANRKTARQPRQAKLLDEVGGPEQMGLFDGE